MMMQTERIDLLQKRLDVLLQNDRALFIEHRGEDLVSGQRIRQHHAQDGQLLIVSGDLQTGS